ncbi:hypothetical protein GCM10010954_06150 [Halobacillus andaensis]|uniref:Helix-turn-helix domain-containing protein n=1 Tax=Halobacillus andaensis TaxID=1176239 RepID=A0A917AZZ8_HALAA|nr:hypothetical protein [Halobacillus andaensis]MBP2003405.1 hypothetical protein [Halobacillus andaensis]GGF10354.1 hypothetical protein GCM10010954_06150 [Halobacillus andaensis]
MIQYNVEQALEKLKQYKITNNKESLRRWLRNGTLKGIPPTSRKKGWKINESDLWEFIKERVPEESLIKNNTTNVAKNGDYREFVRSEMWWELVRKNLFEGAIEVKRKDIQLCIEQLNYTKDFEDHLWDQINEHTWQATPRIFYLHDAFLFRSHRIKMNTDCIEIKEQILFSLINHFVDD